MTLFYERCNMLHVIALAVLPAIILIYYTYLQDKLQREPVGNIVRGRFPLWAPKKGRVLGPFLVPYTFDSREN